MPTIAFTVVYGAAGTGKTTHAVNIIKQAIASNTDFIVLALTHSAVLNFYNKLNDSTINFNEHFKTIHSFFRIDYLNNNKCLGPRGVPSLVIIDEISMISIDILNIIYRYLNSAASMHDVNVYLLGDPLQLNAIVDDDSITYKTLLTLDNEIYNKHNMHVPIRVLKHLYTSVFYNDKLTSALRHQLTISYRHNDSVTKVLNALMNNDTSYKYKWLSKVAVINKLMQGSYFLASTYNNLQDIYDAYANYLPRDHIKIDQMYIPEGNYKRLYLYKGTKIMTLMNTDMYYNGQQLTVQGIDKQKLICTDDNDKTVIVNAEGKAPRHYFPVGPANIITIHKSQGRTLKSIIICIDNLFDLTMLYTAVTRASDEVYFYSRKGNDVKTLINSMNSNELKMLQTIIQV